MTNRMVRVAGPDLRNMRSHAEGCVDETPGPETGRVLSGTNGRYSSPRGADDTPLRASTTGTLNLPHRGRPS